MKEINFKLGFIRREGERKGRASPLQTAVHVESEVSKFLLLNFCAFKVLQASVGEHQHYHHHHRQARMPSPSTTTLTSGQGSEAKFR